MIDAIKAALILAGLGFVLWTLYHVYMIIYTGANPFQ